jgi:hypothetical protein
MSREVRFIEILLARTVSGLLTRRKSGDALKRVSTDKLQLHPVKERVAAVVEIPETAVSGVLVLV